jgi:hypothetical protein
VLAGLTLALYAITGFHVLTGIAWLASILLISFALKLGRNDSRGSDPMYGKRDIVAGVLLAALFSPIYLFASYEIPFQVNSDELVHIDVERNLTGDPRADVFGLVSNYFYFPAGSFVLHAYLAERLGAITLENVRRVNGFLGICIVFTGYLFFRLFSPLKFAVLATLVFGSSHVLVGISRMAMRENTCLILELTALTLSIYGARTSDPGKLFAGGAIMGLAVYTYFPARIIAVIWLCYLILSSWPYRDDSIRRLRKLSGWAMIGFIISAGPMAIATWKAPTAQYAYVSNVTIFTAAGQEIVRKWEGITDTKAALLSNLMNGLGTFNNNMTDRAMIYVNSGYGFVDPLTGVLLWAGIISMLARHRSRELHLLALTGFLVIWLSLSFFTTKNPSYSRLLVILPFVVLLAMEGSKWLAAVAAKYLAGWLGMPRRNTVYVVVTVLVAVIIGWNLKIYGKYVAEGFYQREVVGAMVRYVQTRQNLRKFHYYVIDEGYSQFWFGPYAVKDWISLFTSPQQLAVVAGRGILEAKTSPTIDRPASLLMSSKLWASYENQVLQRHPHAIVNYIDGSLMFVAVEIF